MFLYFDVLPEVKMKPFDYQKINDLTFFAEHRLPAHSDHPFYPSGTTAQSSQYGQDDFYCSLNGVWKFAFAPNVQSAIAEFADPGFDCRNWADIRVPGSIQLQGYDIPNTLMSSTPGMAARQLPRTRHRNASIPSLPMSVISPCQTGLKTSRSSSHSRALKVPWFSG